MIGSAPNFFVSRVGYPQWIMRVVSLESLQVFMETIPEEKRSKEAHNH